jgi:hypothetical protein
MKLLLPLVFMLALSACNSKPNTKERLPSAVYEYVQVDSAAFADKHAVYVPVYSHIYTEAGTSSLVLATTLSIRNTSFTDSFYVSNVSYYGSQGEILKRYLNSSVLLRPLASIEFVVERTENKGGAGANFVVNWGATKTGVEPLIQTVMVETGTGISFVTQGVEMK